ncbi:MAG: 5-formyltetrahydrofolate cyclo-ligase [Bacteroidota bacterium]|nr:5-formyltetrahydrofolate cyclo-ligase [Bacteroidota bacterium]
MTTDINREKNRLRKEIKIIKDNIPYSEKKLRSKSIWEKIEKDTIFQASKIVLIYWSMKDEVFTHDFVEKWHEDKKILLPVVDGNTLLLKQYNGIESMKKGELFNILEPTGQEFTDTNSIDLIIVPGVAFDKENNRMGRGKAYYDKLLQTTSCPKYGVCFNFQYLDKIPTEQHDIKMDRIIVLEK